MIREILRLGDARLLRTAQVVTDIQHPTVKTAIIDMYDTLQAAKAFGLADCRWSS